MNICGSVTLTIAVLMCVVIGSKGEEMTKKMNMTCDGHNMAEALQTQFAKAQGECFKKYAPADETDKMAQWKVVAANTCFQVCKFQAKGMLDSTGAFSEKDAEESMKKFYPTEELSTKMMTAGKECVKNNGPLPLSMDNNCEAYKGLFKCITEQHMKICKIEMPPGMEQ